MAFSVAHDGLNVGSGNRCGHNPTQPNFLVQTHKANIPRILSRAIEVIEEYFPRLKEIAQLDTLNPHRKKRSERREAIIQAIKALLKYCDLVTLTVGIPTKSGRVGLTLARLHKETTLSWPRFKRAISDLRAAGFLSIAQPRMTNKAGQVRGVVGVKALSIRLFEALKLDFWLRRERDRASKRQRAKARAEGVTQRSFYHGASSARSAERTGGPLAPCAEVAPPTSWGAFKARAASRRPLS